MEISFETPTSDRLVAHLRDGGATTTVSGCPRKEATAGLRSALEAARREGVGECAWTEALGQYWWILRADSGDVEVVVLWSSGAATGWQHVFRAIDDSGTLVERLQAELDRQARGPQG